MKYYICTSILRGGAVVARWAHNPKVGGSNPPSATSQKPRCECTGALLFSARAEPAQARDVKNKAPDHTQCGEAFDLLSTHRGTRAKRAILIS